MDKYFAAQTASELAAHLDEHATTWMSTQTRSGLLNRRLESYRLYYGRNFNLGTGLNGSSTLQRGGRQGELTLLSINQYRNLLQHILVMTTSQRPAFDARATNSDSKSLMQAKLANNILDSYLREKRLGRYLKKAGEHALVLANGYVLVTWEPSLGRPYSKQEVLNDNGEPEERVVYEGDVQIRTPSFLDVYTDPTQEDWNLIDWARIRGWRNKYSLAARYPQLREKILSLPTKNEMDRLNTLTFNTLDDSCDVEVKEFYHKRTDALPNGRYMLYCDADTILYDGPIPYRRLPIYRIVPGEIFGTTEGYTAGFDLIAIQRAFDILTSTVLSNQVAHGVQKVIMPNGSNITTEQLSQGLAVLKYDPGIGKPEALQLTSSPPEIFKFIEMLNGFAETVSGVNSVARGNPDSSLKSGVALGLVQSMAIQFASGFQESWVELLEDVGTFILELLKDFAQTERMVAMAGKHNRGYMAAFTGKDLENVDRVIVEVGNPLSRTTAGRVQIADNLLEKGLIKTPQEYITVMNTGILDPATESSEAQLALIRKENEDLMEGLPVRALISDAHMLHAQEHLTVVSNPELRRRAADGDPQAMAIVQNALNHVQEHMQQKQMQDPLMSAISGEPPAPPPPMPAGPPMDAPMPQPEMPGDMPPPPMPDSAAPLPPGPIPQGVM